MVENHVRRPTARLMPPTRPKIRGRFPRHPSLRTCPTWMTAATVIACHLEVSAAPVTNGIPEPSFHHSFVRDINRQIVAADFRYAADVQAQVGMHYSMVDIVMQQCFGGGFLNDIQAA